MKKIKVKITVGDRAITLEGPEEFVRAEIERIAGLPADTPAPSSSGVGPRQPGPQAPRSEEQVVADKSPSGHGETVAVLAFYMRENGTTEFDADEMRRAYIRAKCRPPKVMAQALRDAKNKGDLIEHGSARGKFRLSPHGERTVIFDLPRARPTS